MKIKLLLNLFLVCFLTYGQNLDQIGKAPIVKVNGGISANSVYYTGSANRDPFTYFLNGNLNINISGIYNIPLSFSYTNQDFSYSTPFKINRLSIHPSYKWVATHIGDVAMTFSPYTVSGHQFTGFGTDLTPNKPWKLSAFYGRLLKATEYNPEVPEAIPAYQRMGYGLKAAYDFKKFNVGLTLFKAKDDENSLDVPIPDDLNFDPKENLVISLESSINITKQFSFNFEVAQSAVTENVLDNKAEENSNILGFLINEKASTDYFTALNADFTYNYGKGSVGVGYERIDPKYRTFGAYFFNNDLENITVNAAQELFNGKVSLAVNAGLQRDDLKNEKESQSNRIVSAINTNIKATDRLNIGASYSNFQSFTNIRTVFDEINQANELENLDTLDFKQVAQNASLNVSYILSQSKRKQQNIGLGLTFQTTKDEQGTAEATNTETNFYNAGANYSIAYPEQSLTITGALNAAYNTLQGSDALTYGPTLAVTKQFFNKKLRTGFSASYNESLTNGESQGNVMNYRANAGYVYKQKHNFSLNALTLLRNSTNTSNANDFTLTFGYTYSFDVKKPDLRFRKRSTKNNEQQKTKAADTLNKLEKKLKKEKTPKENYYRFRYQGEIYEGPALQVAEKIESISKSEFLNSNNAFDQTTLQSLLTDLKANAREDDNFRNKAIDYLDSLYVRKNFIAIYDQQFQKTLVRLRQELINKHDQMRDQFARAKEKLESHPLHNKDESAKNEASEQDQFEYMKLKTIHKVDGERLESYLFLRIEVEKALQGNSISKKDEHLKRIQRSTKTKAFRVYQKEKNIEKINIYLEEQIIKYYDELYRTTGQ